MAIANPPASAEQTFITELARRTGLARAVIKAWLTREGTYAPGGTGGFNFLNLRPAPGGRSYSGVPLAGVSSGNFQQFRSVDDAVRETAHWILRMPNYQGIRAAARRSPEAQLEAIARSPWSADHYGGPESLKETYRNVLRNVRPGSATAGSRSTAKPVRLADHLVGKSVERVNPDLVARLWLLGAFLGKKITVTSGHRSDEEQTRIWDSGVRPAARPVSRGGGGSNHTRGQAVDATIDGEPIATAVGEGTLRQFGLKSLASIGDPVHVELRQRSGFDPSGAQPISATLVPRVAAVLGKLSRPLRDKIGRLRGGSGAAAGGVGGALTAEALSSAIKAGGFLALLTTDVGRKAALTLLLAVLGLALILIGTLRLVGLRPATVVNVALRREV